MTAVAQVTAAEVDALWLSLRVGAVATLVALPPGLSIALWLARTRSRLRAVVEAVVLTPMVLPPIVVGYLLLVAFGRGGALGEPLQSWLGVSLPFTWLGAALAAGVLGFPLLVRGARQAFEAVDPGLVEAAAGLGAGPIRAWWTVTMPLAARGCVAAAGLCFARSLGEFGATITFAGNIAGETRTLPLAIWTALQDPATEPAAWRLTWLCVALSVVATLASEWLGRRVRRGRPA